LNERKIRRNLLQDQIAEWEKTAKNVSNEVDVRTKARWVLSEVSRLTQGRLTDYIESMVTMAIRSVYDRPYYFLVDFKIQHNKSECFFSVYEGPEKPREEMLVDSFFLDKDEEEGGGLVSVVSFALRVVLWSLEKPRSNNVIFLDEPFSGLGKLRPRAVRLLTDISHELGIQFIVITHDDELAEMGDAAWRVAFDGTESRVTQIVPIHSISVSEAVQSKSVARRMRVQS
jgi:hypothetical protein